MSVSAAPSIDTALTFRFVPSTVAVKARRLFPVSCTAPFSARLKVIVSAAPSTSADSGAGSVGVQFHSTRCAASAASPSCASAAWRFSPSVCATARIVPPSSSSEFSSTASPAAATSFSATV